MQQDDPPTGNLTQPSSEEVHWELNHILASPHLQTSEKRRAFLRYIVEETLAGRSGKLKGYTIAIAVFGRNESFDAQTDPVVRVEARRLRRDLDSYYMNAGESDAVRISIPKGGYVPHFEKVIESLPRGSADDERAVVSEPVSDIGLSADEKPVITNKRRSSRYGMFVVAVIAVLAIATAIWSLNPESTALGTKAVVDEPSVMVLPFEALGSGESIYHIASGISQELVNDLMRFPGFRLYSLSTGERPDMDTFIADSRQTPEVAFIVSGSVREDGEQAHVVARMNHASTGEVLWSQKYDRPLTPHSMIQLQTDLAAAIATQVGQPYGYIQTDLQSRTTTAAVSNRQSYVCVLRAYTYRRAFEWDEFAPVMQCLETAVQNDPQYSDAWAMLGWLHLDAGRFDFYGPDRLTAEYDKAFQAASRAVQLEPDNTLALRALSAINHYMGQFEQAEQLARRAVELNPNDPDVLAHLGWRLAVRGNFDEGIPLLERAIERTVNPPGWYFHLIALDLYLTGDYENMLTVAQRSAIDGSEIGNALVAIAYGALEDRKGAKQALEKLPEPRLILTDPTGYFARHGATEENVAALTAGLVHAEQVAYGRAE